MSISANPYTEDKPIEILKSYNDYLHLATSNHKYVFIVEQDLTDPRMFTIVKDSLYDNNLEGVKLIFNNPDDFKQKFPHFFVAPPVHVPTNTRRNERTGKIEGIKKDPIKHVIEQVENNQYLVTLEDLSDVGCIWLYSFQSEKFTVTFYTSDDKVTFKVIPHLKGMSTTIRDSSGQLIEKYLPFNVDPDSENPTQTITTRYIMIVVHGGDLVYTPRIDVKITRAFGI